MKTNSPFEYCERIARGHYENFPIGWFIPKSLQKYVYALYAFARTADDFADESLNGNRLEKLNEWQDRLNKASQGEADHPIFEALVETFEKTSIPPKLLLDLLTAFRWDVTKNRYQSYAELLDYCRYSANPIGRAVLLLFDYSDPKLLGWSDKICTGIQLVNHWQDVAVDLQKRRVYLPEEDLKKFGYSYDDLSQKKRSESFCRLMQFEIDRARRLFEEGKPLLSALHRRLRWQVELMWQGPLRILKKIENFQFDVFDHRPTLSKPELVGMFLRNRLHV